jgi:hypothetical protein
MTRIYGVAFEQKEELEGHLKMLEEAAKRDHRKLGKELELFQITQEYGGGLVLWMPNGAFIRKTIEDFWRDEHLRARLQLPVHAARGPGDPVGPLRSQPELPRLHVFAPWRSKGRCISSSR